MNQKTRLIIARHGNTFNSEDIVRRVGITDLPLVDSGLLQGQRLGSYLQQNNLIPDVIFTSTLKRTIQTAQQAQSAMGIKLPIKSMGLFNEIDYGQDENQAESDVVARIGQEALNSWEKQAIVPQGWNVNPQEIIKNWHDFSKLLVEEYAHKTILVITSNGIARFAPHITGDFNSFALKHNIKISTGALCIFEKTYNTAYWNCLEWNIKP